MRHADQKRSGSGKLPPRLNGRRDKKHVRGSAHAATSDDLGSVVAASSVDTGEILSKIENWENEVLPKIEKWNNEMAMNIPAPSVIASEPLPPRSQSFHISVCNICYTGCICSGKHYVTV